MLSKVEIGAIVAVLIAIITGSMWLGKLDGRVASLEGSVQELKNTLNASKWKPIEEPQLSHTPPSPPPPSGCVDNLLNCVTFGQMNVPGKSSATVIPIPGGGLSLKFKNEESGTGVFFKFSSPVNLQNFDRLRIRGTSKTEFEFQVEYKVKGSNEPIAFSDRKRFPATTNSESIFIPIPLEQIDGRGIDTIAISCLRKKDNSTFNIESIKLLKPSDPQW